jgi:MFS family permease
MPLIWLINDPLWLFPVILVYGGCVALCFTLSEFWIAALTPAHRRGFVMGLYATLLSIGFAIGPVIIAVFRDGSVRPFLIGGGVLIAAALPALIARRESPKFDGHPRMRFTGYLLAAPSATLGAFVFAMGESGGFAFLPLWGHHLGFSPSLAVFLVSAMTLGNVVFQIPLGLLADRSFDRRLVLLACAIFGALGMPLAWMLAASPAALIVVLFVWGGVTAGIYTVGLAHLSSRFSGGELASANAAFVFCYGLGMLVGPATLGDAVSRAPIFGFPLVLGIAFAIYAAIVAWRIRRSA